MVRISGSEFSREGCCRHGSGGEARRRAWAPPAGAVDDDRPEGPMAGGKRLTQLANCGGGVCMWLVGGAAGGLGSGGSGRQGQTFGEVQFLFVHFVVWVLVLRGALLILSNPSSVAAQSGCGCSLFSRNFGGVLS